MAVTRKVFSALTGGKNNEAIAGPLKIGYIPSHLKHPALSAEVAECIQEAMKVLKGAGSTFVEIDNAPFAALEETFEDILLYEAWQVHSQQVSSAPESYGPETLRLLQAAAQVSESAYQKALARRLELLPAARALYNDIDLLLTPAAPYVAPSTTPPVDTPEGAAEGAFTGIFNITGDPAIVLPCGWSAAGLPIGVQLSSALGSDNYLLAAAVYIEEVINCEVRAPAL